MNILITGATGFIGRNLVADLMSFPDTNITCLVRKTSNLDQLPKNKISFVYGDISDARSLTKAFANSDKFDLIYHCAAFVENKYPKKLEKINVLGTKNICELVLNLSIPKLVYLSSVAVVSGNPNIPLTEDLPYRATNAYGESKIAAEKIVQAYRQNQFKQKNIKTAIFRPPMVYGPGEPHMMGLLLKLIKFRMIPAFFKGTTKLHLVYVKNLTQGLIYCIDKDDFFHDELFIADNEVLTIRQILDCMAKGINSKIWDLPDWMTNLLLKFGPFKKRLDFLFKDRVYSIKRIKSLGFDPLYPADLALTRSSRDFKLT